MIRRLRRRAPCGDAGTTLMELVVGMVIMTIFMGMFTTAVVMLNKAQNKAEAVNNTSAQLNQAFMTLDKTVRYAAAISAPGKGPSGDWYVELRTTNTGTEVCTQLHVSFAKQQLEKRSWDPANPPLPSTLSFTRVADGISNGRELVNSSDRPFVLQDTSATLPFQQLTFTLISKSGSTSPQTSSRSSFTFGAINSTPVPTTPICPQERL